MIRLITKGLFQRSYRNVIPIHNPHDKLFKRALAGVEVAKDFFDIHLPKEWKSHCNLGTLRYPMTRMSKTSIKNTSVM